MEEGKGQVNGFRLVVRQRKSNCRRDAAASLPPRPGAGGSRVCGCTPSFCLPQELAEEWVIQLVPSSARAYQEAFLKEAGQVLSVDFSGEVMGWNFAFAQAREFTDECAVLGAQL